MIKVPLAMTQPKPLSASVLLHIAQLLNVPLKGMISVIELLDEGATVPFIARYRKEVTGNLDEVQIRDIQEKLEYFREVLRRPDKPRTSFFFCDEFQQFFTTMQGKGDADFF